MKSLKIQKKYFETIAINLVFLLLLNNPAFAFQPIVERPKNNCLAPTSKFNPIAVIKKQTDKFTLLADREDSARCIADFKSNVGMAFISPLIELGLRFGLSGKGIKRLIGENLSRVAVNISDVKWRNLFKEGNKVYLPYLDENGNERTAHYYMAEGGKHPKLVLEIPFREIEWIREKPIYQIMLKDYAPSNYGKSTFSYIKDDIDRFVREGIGTIWLCGTASNVNGTTPFSVLDPMKVEERYGSREELAKLIREAHSKGIKVITDYIPNHVSIHSELCQTHPDWFIKDKDGNFVHATDNRPLHGWPECAQFDFSNAEVRKYLMDIAYFWLELGFDGFRLDAPLALLKDRMIRNWYEGREDEIEKTFTREFWEVFTTNIRKRYPQAAFIAEYLGDEPDVAEVLLDNCSIDLTFDIQFSCLLYDVLKGQNGKTSTDIMDYLRDHIKGKIFARKVHYKDTHDIRDTTKIDFQIGQERLRAFTADEIRLVSTLIVTLPGVPMFFNGEPEAILGYEYRVNEEFPIPWHNVDREMRSFYEKLLAIANQPIFRKGEAEVIEQKFNKNPNIVAFLREYDGEKIIIAANVRNKTGTADVEDWTNIDIGPILGPDTRYVAVEGAFSGKKYGSFSFSEIQKNGLPVGLGPLEVQILRINEVTESTSVDKKWHEVKTKETIDVEKVKDALYEIREIIDYINQHLDEDQLLEEEDFTSQLIEQYGDAVKRFNEVILNGPMTAERLEEEYKDFHEKIGKKGLIPSAGSYGLEEMNHVAEVENVFNDLFSEEYDERIKQDPINTASHAFVALVNLQPFHDGNKRAASLIMNYILMKSGYTPFILTEDNIISYTQIMRPINEENEIDEEKFHKFLDEEVRRISRPSYFVGQKTKEEKQEEENTEYISEKTGAASDFVDTIILRAIEAGKRDEKIIIGIDTSWIPQEQLSMLSGLNGLLNELTRRAKKKGLDNIVVLKEKGGRLADLLIEEAGETNKKYSNIIVLGSQKALEGKAFRLLRSHKNPDNWAFFAGINLPDDFNKKSYIMLLEMLELTIERAFNKDARRDDISVTLFQPDGQKAPVPRYIILVPKAKAFEYEVLQQIYNGQRKILTAA